MSKLGQRVCLVMASLPLAGAVACADVSGTAEPTRLEEVVVPDERFDFATARAVRLDLVVHEGAEPQAIEVLDTEGRRLMDGAFKSSVSLDLQVAAGRDQSLQLRVGQGDAVTTRVVAVDADGRASTEL
jgi:hypothetical protein